MNEHVKIVKVKGKGAKLSPRLRTLVAILPQFKWDVPAAAISLGYSKSYAEKRLPFILDKNVEFCRLVQSRRERIAEKVDYSVLKWFAETDDALADAIENGDSAARVQLLRMRGQYIGAFQKDNEQKGSKALGVIVFDPSKALPSQETTAGFIEGEIVADPA